MRLLKPLLLALTIITLSASVSAETRITVSHPEITAPTYIDHGKPGQSIGDVRIWQFEAKASDGVVVTTDWILTTTGVLADSGLEYRTTSAVFSFGEGTVDQIVIQGVAQYPSTKATLDQSLPTRRAITGGTGKFAGVGGWMESTHLPNGGGWQHILYLK